MGAVTIVETAYLPLSDLVPFPGNARRGNVAKIRESVKKNGQYRSVLVRQVDGAYVVVAGNHTAQAMREEGFNEARCEIIECSDETAVAVNLADNRLSDLGAYDDEALSELLMSLDGDYSATGYEEGDLEELMESIGHEEVYVPPVPRPENDGPTLPPAAMDGTPGDTGIRETVLALNVEDHDELHLTLVRLRSLLGDTSGKTNGEIVLMAAKCLKLAVEVRRTHDGDCICEICVLVATLAG